MNLNLVLDEFDEDIISSRDNTYKQFYSKFEIYGKQIKEFCRSIILSFPPGYFTYYYLFPEFRSRDGVVTEYFGVEKKYPKRRRLIKNSKKTEDEFLNFRQLTEFDHIVRINGETAAYLYVDLRMFSYREHKQVRLKEKHLIAQKNKLNRQEK